MIDEVNLLQGTYFYRPSSKSIFIRTEDSIYISQYNTNYNPEDIFYFLHYISFNEEHGCIKLQATSFSEAVEEISPYLVMGELTEGSGII